MAVRVYRRTTNNIRIFTLVYTLVLFAPTVMLNSAFWGQCDSIYAAFILLSLYFMTRENYVASFALFGIAFAFKLQAIFILPLFIIIAFANRSFSMLNFLVSPLATILVSLPGMILTGGGLKGFLDIYLGQTSHNEGLVQNFPNIYYWLSAEHHELIRKLGILFTIIIFIVMFTVFCQKSDKVINKNGMVSLGLWCVLCCVYFLPNMHERYGYVAEILCIVWAFGHKKHVWYPLLINMLALFSYFAYLFGYSLYWFQNMAVVGIAAFLFFFNLYAS